MGAARRRLLRGLLNLCGCAPAEDLAGSTVHLEGDGLELVVRHLVEVGALREVLAEEPVLVVIRRPLPWAVRVAEEHVDVGVDLVHVP